MLKDDHVSLVDAPHMIKPKQNLQLLEKEFKDKKTLITNVPTHLGFLLGNRCNLRCKMCGNRGLLTRLGLRKTTKLSKKALNDIISYFPYLTMLTMSGGEALTYRETKDIVESAEKFPNIDLKMITNGNLINDYWVNKFSEIPFKFIDISLDAATQKTYQQIRVRGDLNKVIKSVRRINEIKNGQDPKICASYVVMRKNMNEIIKFVEFAHKHGISRLTFAALGNQRYFFYNAEKVLPRKECCYELLKINEKARDLCEDYNIELFNQVPGNILLDNPKVFFDYHNVKRSDLNDDESFECKRFWRRLDISPFYFSLCQFAIMKKWDIVRFYSPTTSDPPSIKEVWNGEKSVEGRKLLIDHQYDKVCRLSCLTYFKHKTKGLI